MRTQLWLQEIENLNQMTNQKGLLIVYLFSMVYESRVTYLRVLKYVFFDLGQYKVTINDNTNFL